MSLHIRLGKTRTLQPDLVEERHPAVRSGVPASDTDGQQPSESLHLERHSGSPYLEWEYLGVEKVWS